MKDVTIDGSGNAYTNAYLANVDNVVYQQSASSSMNAMRLKISPVIHVGLISGANVSTQGLLGYGTISMLITPSSYQNVLTTIYMRDSNYDGSSEVQISFNGNTNQATVQIGYQTQTISLGAPNATNNIWIQWNSSSVTVSLNGAIVTSNINLVGVLYYFGCSVYVGANFQIPSDLQLLESYISSIQFCPMNCSQCSNFSTISNELNTYSAAVNLNQSQSNITLYPINPSIILQFTVLPQSGKLMYYDNINNNWTQATLGTVTTQKQYMFQFGQNFSNENVQYLIINNGIISSNAAIIINYSLTTTSPTSISTSPSTSKLQQQ